MIRVDPTAKTSIRGHSKAGSINTLHSQLLLLTHNPNLCFPFLLSGRQNLRRHYFASVQPLPRHRTRPYRVSVVIQAGSYIHCGEKSTYTIQDTHAQTRRARSIKFFAVNIRAGLINRAYLDRART